MCFRELVAGNRKFGGAGGRLLTKFILQPGVRFRAAKGPQPPTDHRPNQEGNRCPEQPFDQSHLRNLRSDHTERTGFSGWSSPDDLELTVLTENTGGGKPLVDADMNQPRPPARSMDLKKFAPGAPGIGLISYPPDIRIRRRYGQLPRTGLGMKFRLPDPDGWDAGATGSPWRLGK